MVPILRPDPAGGGRGQVCLMVRRVVRGAHSGSSAVAGTSRPRPEPATTSARYGSRSSAARRVPSM
jgi:hypothetical protein